MCLLVVVVVAAAEEDAGGSGGAAVLRAVFPFDSLSSNLGGSATPKEREVDLFLAPVCTVRNLCAVTVAYCNRCTVSQINYDEIIK